MVPLLNRVAYQAVKSSQVTVEMSTRVMRSHLRSIHTSPTLQANKPSQVKPKPRGIPAYKTPTRTPTQPSHFPKPTAPPKPNPFRYRSTPFFLGGLVLCATTAYGTYLFIALTRPNTEPIPTSADEQQDVSSRYDTIATSFDAEVAWTEWSMGITSLRKKLAAEASGDVLEVSIGTGRNLEYYDWDFKGFNGVGSPNGKGFLKRGKMRSFTAVDKSEEMLEVAHDKFGEQFPGILGVRWVVADAAERGSIPLPPRNANEKSGNLERKYDTIVQTMGLCSANDPVALLRNLGELVKEDEGRILLLEHGRGRWKWLNGVLDKFAEGHAKQFGCWWNRDIWEIVKESGLEVVKLETPNLLHGGTTYWVELRKKGKPEVVKKVEEKASKVVTEKIPETVSQVSQNLAKKSWW